MLHTILDRLKNIMVPPEMRGLELDDPRFADKCHEQIRTKPYLNRIYREWYARLAGLIPASGGLMLELGSGSGFMSESIPGVICSDVKPHKNIPLLVDAANLPFADGSIRALLMTNTLHHLRDPRGFFREATRTVREGGVIAMVEPWNNALSRFIHQNLHHEPFLPERAEWEPPVFSDGHANGAVPWMLFSRDRAAFEREFPQWEIKLIRPFMPVSYALSGGVSMRSLLPGWAYPLCRLIERPFERYTGMLAVILLVRR